MRLRIGTVTTAGLLFLAGAVGLVGAWALGAATVLIVAVSVGTAIAWEDRDVQARVASLEALELEGLGSPS